MHVCEIPLTLLHTPTLHAMFHLISLSSPLRPIAVPHPLLPYITLRILSDPKLRHLRPARTLTHVFVLALNMSNLDRILSRFPAERKKFRRACVWMAFRRKFLRHARLTKYVTEQMVEALRKSGSSIADLKELFELADDDNSGDLSLGELKKVRTRINIVTMGEIRI